MNNPYEVLEIPPDAPRLLVGQAHAKLSRTHHPDRGGDPEKFREVQEAFELLADPARRAHFDKTGEDLPGKQANPHADIIPVLSDAFADTLEVVLKAGLNVERDDFVSRMKQVLNAHLKKANEEAAAADTLLDALARMQQRFGPGPESDNILEAVRLRTGAQAEYEKRVLTARAALLRKALVHVSGYVYRVDRARDPYLINSGALGWVDWPVNTEE